LTRSRRTIADKRGVRALPPPLKWAGGKRWLVPELAPLWERHSSRRLVEPFCGGLAVTLAFRPRSALLNDRNPHLIAFYSWLKRGLVIAAPMKYDRDFYYAQRERFNELPRGNSAKSPEAAGLFYYLNRSGFNGLCRFNSRGKFNVPFGKYRSVRYTRDFGAYRAAFADWEFRCGDFESLRLAEDDFIYADPPYDVEFTQYSREPFGWEEQERAAKWLARHPGPVVLSNQATDRIVALYKEQGFELRFLDGPRRISCTGDRTPAKEVLAVRNVG